jgi:hypothetical protein
VLLRLLGDSKIGHAGQRGRMVVAERLLESFHHLHVQLFCFGPSALIPAHQRQIVHAGQRVWMVVAEMY